MISELGYVPRQRGHKVLHLLPSSGSRNGTSGLDHRQAEALGCPRYVFLRDVYERPYGIHISPSEVSRGGKAPQTRLIKHVQKECLYGIVEVVCERHLLVSELICRFVERTRRRLEHRLQAFFFEG